MSPIDSPDENSSWPRCFIKAFASGPASTSGRCPRIGTRNTGPSRRYCLVKNLLRAVSIGTRLPTSGSPGASGMLAVDAGAINAEVTGCAEAAATRQPGGVVIGV